MPEIIIENGLQKGERFKVEPNESIWIGRDLELVVTVNDPMVSRRHCRIERRGSRYHLLDNKSANGTFLNGTRQQKHPVVKGDRIHVGETTLTFFPDVVDDPLIGKTVSGFEVLERVGRGGMGTVYKARQLSLDRMVALKVLSRDLAEDRTFVDAFHHEARAAGQINHPSIVQVYDVDSVQIGGKEITFFAMEFMPGGSVEDLLNRVKQLSELRALEIALDTARGLEYAERRNIVHRDIKPGNIMLSDSGVAKIGDLGVARRAEKGKVSQKDGVSGSPHYIAPEQAKGEDLDSGADMYSLGVSVFQMVTGRTPFWGKSAKELVLKHFNEELPSIQELRPGVEPGVVALVERLTQKKRDDRYENVANLITDLETIIPRIRARGSRSRLSSVLRHAAFVVGALLIVVAAGALIGLIWNRQRNDSERVELAKRDELETHLASLREKIDAHSFDDARRVLEKLQNAVNGDDRYNGEAADVVRQIDDARVELEEIEGEVEEARREETARAELDAILEKLPRPNAVREIKEFDSVLKILKEWAPRFPGTSAFVQAARRIPELEDARAALARRLQVATEEYPTIEKRVQTLLRFNPPSFKSALTVVREFLDKHAETPTAAQAKRLLNTLAKQMDGYVTDTLAELQGATGTARSGILRRLQRLRLEVEGEALSVIDAALAK